MINRRDFSNSKCIYEAEEMFEWKKWQKQIPYIKFKRTWEVKIIPPFHGAIIRYNIRHIKYPDTYVSVYLDCYNQLGYWDGQYWEIYPFIEGIYRCSMNNTDELIDAIDTSLNQQIKRIKQCCTK